MSCESRRVPTLNSPLPTKEVKVNRQPLIGVLRMGAAVSTVAMVWGVGRVMLALPASVDGGLAVVAAMLFAYKFERQ